MSENRRILRPAAVLAVFATVFFSQLNGAAAAGLRLELLQANALASFEPGRQLGRQNGVWSLKLELKIRLWNDGDEALDLQGADLFVESSGVLIRRREDGENRFPQLGTLEAGQSLDGTAQYILLPWPTEPARLQVKFGVEGEPDDNNPVLDAEGRLVPVLTGDVQAAVPLLQWVRESSRLGIERPGPGGALALIRTERDLDVLSVWVLEGIFRELLGEGVERVLLTSGGEVRRTVSDEVGGWLSGLQQSAFRNLQPGGLGGMLPQPANNQLPLPTLDRPLRFAGVAEMGQLEGSTNPYARRRAGRTDMPLAEAISEALAPVYRYAPIADVIQGLGSEIAGVRLAALAGAVDRLTEEEAAAVLERARSGSVQQQLEVAAWLNQIPGRRAVLVLQEMATGENEELAAAAIRGLATSREETAEGAMAAVWESGATRPALRTQAAAAMVRSGDDRWAAFVAAWVQDFLRLSRDGQSGGIQPEQVRGAVAFLLDRRHEATQVLVREQLPFIRQAKFQDPLMRLLLDQGQSLDLSAVHKAADQRIRDGEITLEVLYAAMILRDSSWTERLLEDYQQPRNSGRQEDQRSLQPIIACATKAQIDGLVAAWKQLNRAAQSELLVHLAAIEHPEWKTLAADQLQAGTDISETAINLLSQDASEESLSLLRGLLLRQVASLEGTKDASARGQDQMQRLMAQIAGFVHPECRRLINQLCRDGNKYVRDLAREQRANALVRSPAVRSLQQEGQLRDSDRAKEADEMLEEVLRLDPFLAEGWLRRSSVRMHAGNFDASMEDLRHAAELSPEHVEVESMISLVMVRQGRVADGLLASDRLIASVPFDDYALYNGACSYARAAERAETSAEDKARWIARAVELIKATNATGFDDHEHLAEDTDLRILHEHAEWPGLLEAARNNSGRER